MPKIPNSIPKLRIRKGLYLVWDIGNCILIFIWDLEIGIWNLELILKYAIPFKSPFEKGGHRGICLGMP
jgi:hypothetical protein